MFEGYHFFLGIWSLFYFLIGENINGNKEWIKRTNFNFYEESEFKELYKSFFLDEIFNTYKLKERYKDWEIIDFR